MADTYARHTWVDGEVITEEKLNNIEQGITEAMQKGNNLDIVKQTADGAKKAIDDHIADDKNPHKVTKAQIGLDKVENVAVNDMAPTYTDTNTLATIKSGEKASSVYAKIKLAITKLIEHIQNESNPHKVTKSQLGLDKVENVATNDLAPTYTDITTLSTLKSGEKISAAFAKIKLAITKLMEHMQNNTNPHKVTLSQLGLEMSAKEINDLNNHTHDDRYYTETEIDSKLEEVLQEAKDAAVPDTGYFFFTSDAEFKVPNGVYAIKVSACAAGVGRYAGEYLIDRIFNVTPGQVIDLTIGAGNTIIGELATLIAGTVLSATPTTKLGYAAGYNGGTGAGDSAKQGAGGYGGAFGYGGGGGGGQITSISSVSRGGGGAGGAGIGGAGATPTSYGANEGAGGGTTGGSGGSGNASDNPSQVASNGADSTSGKIVYEGATVGNGTTGGGGSIYGAGGGGGASYKNKTAGGGGAAGGYGAGGGVSGDGSTVTGEPSGGMVLIEWGGAVA